MNGNMGDNGDMKIAGMEPAADNMAADSAAIENYDRLRRNGDIARARRLGASAAGSINEIHSSLGLNASEDEIVLHERLLVIFSAAAALETCLSERILSHAALNVFYDVLKKDAPELYDAMSVSGAVTFYYLEYRKLGEQPADIGGRFAMLCGREDDPELTEIGGRIFTRAYDIVRSAVENTGFSA